MMYPIQDIKVFMSFEFSHTEDSLYPSRDKNLEHLNQAAIPFFYQVDT